MTDQPARNLRSRAWFDNPGNPDMTALYLERYLNFGLSREELQSGKPIVGIAQTGSDLAPCNRHHIELAKRVREGIRDAGGTKIAPAVEKGLREIEKGGLNAIRRMVLLTDGQTENENDCLRQADDAGRRGVPITALGVGKDWNEDNESEGEDDEGEVDEGEDGEGEDDEMDD